jgi:hypothetical protein
MIDFGRDIPFAAISQVEEFSENPVLENESVSLPFCPCHLTLNCNRSLMPESFEPVRFTDELDVFSEEIAFQKPGTFSEKPFFNPEEIETLIEINIFPARKGRICGVELPTRNRS